ncbi:MAG: sugar transferase [Firmicutes bacterium]|nr:sugar transferase [Bacillota bacterium]
MQVKKTFYARYIKRIADVFLSTLILIVLLPVLVIAGILIKLDSAGPIIYTQIRAGKDGRPFTVNKFRTMVDKAEKMGDGLYVGMNDPRITSVGGFLRKTSIDELPQLINVIKGEMSLIGPRPTLLYQVEQYDDFQRQRLLVRPGITGWAQVRGRNSLSWPERIEHDVWYINNLSFCTDLRIFFMTFKALFDTEGLYAEKSKFIIKDENEKSNWKS